MLTPHAVDSYWHVAAKRFCANQPPLPFVAATSW